MEDDKDIYEDLLRMSTMVNIMYESYEKKMEREGEEKEELENKAPSTSFSDHSSSSSYSHHSNEEISKCLQVENVELRRLL